MIPDHYVLKVDCKSVRGIVAAISGYLADKGCNIVDCSQFDDLDTEQVLHARQLHLAGRRDRVPTAQEGFKPIAERFGMTTRSSCSSDTHEGAA